MLDKLTVESQELLVSIREVISEIDEAEAQPVTRERNSDGGSNLKILNLKREKSELEEEQKRIATELEQNKEAVQVLEDFALNTQTYFDEHHLPSYASEHLVGKHPARLLAELVFKTEQMAYASLYMQLLELAKRVLPEMKVHIIREYTAACHGEQPPALNTEVERIEALLALLHRPFFMLHPTTGPFKDPPTGTNNEQRIKALSVIRGAAIKYRALFVPYAAEQKTAETAI